MGRKATGTVYQKPRGKGPWQISFWLKSGNRYTAPVTRDDGGEINESYARKVLAATMLRHENGWDPEAEKPSTAGPMPTVREYGDAWTRLIANENAAADAAWFRNFIHPTTLAAMPLDAVKPTDYRDFVEALKRRPARRGGEPIAARTIRNVTSVLHRIFEAAIFEGRIAVSPLRLPRGVMPSIVDKDPLARSTWIRPREEYEKLIYSPKVPADRHILYALEFLTGARFSEIAALRWRAWLPKRKPLGCLVIAYSRRMKTAQDKSTKKNMVREVPVHPVLAKLLTEWHARGWAKHYGRKPLPDDRIVPADTFAARDPRNNWTRHMEDCDRLEIRRVRQQAARRTFISVTRGRGADKDVVNAITHGRTSEIQDQYNEHPWPVLCDAVKKMQIRAPR